MNDIFARPARESDIQKIDEWIRTTPQNLFDQAILDYSRNIAFLCAHNGDPLVYMPIQSVYMLESLAISPQATALEIAKSLAVLIHTIVYKADESGFNEIYFLCRDKTVSGYAGRHGFETVMYDSERGVTLFRWKICKEPSSSSTK